MKPEATPKHTNRLAGERSPYLLQHQHNPVDWYPWGGYAFAKAREEDKPIFLSIGYSTCHWCHVMEHESFENEETARFLNENFVSIKVDREERPDVDRVYMTFVQATTGSGGWPMTVFLTPELKPFVGGTYFPPRDAYGRPGFPTVLQRISHAWKNDRARLEDQGNHMVEALRDYSSASHPRDGMPGAEDLVAGYRQISQGFDPEWGGFGVAPKFPRPVTLNLLLRIYAREGADSPVGRQALEMSLLTLRKMAAGGMHDHLGGGFHRYSVDQFWHVPHFEKMLYDQAQLSVAYTEAFQATREPLFAEVARDILDYVQRDMTDPEGGFYSAEDADSLFEADKPERGEGAFYTWKTEEIDRVLGPDAEIFNRFYGVEADGNSPSGSDPHGELAGRNTLIQRYSLAEMAKIYKTTGETISASLGRSRARLFEVRSARPRPSLDDKIITAWNGLMISAFARAASALEEPAYLTAATRAAEFIHTWLWDPGAGRLVRSYRQGPSHVEGFVDDYAFLIQGLLDLYEASFDIRWLQSSLLLQEAQDRFFLDHERGGYFSVIADKPDVLLRMKEDYDGAEPSPNSIAALNLLRLAAMTGDAAYLQRADATIRAFATQVTNLPSGMPQMLVAVDWSFSRPVQIVIAGHHDAPDTLRLLREIHQRFLPTKVLLLADSGEGHEWFQERLDFMRTVERVGGAATAYVCEDFTCQLPTTEPEELGRLLGKT